MIKINITLSKTITYTKVIRAIEDLKDEFLEGYSDKIMVSAWVLSNQETFVADLTMKNGLDCYKSIDFCKELGIILDYKAIPLVIIPEIGVKFEGLINKSGLVLPIRSDYFIE